MYCSFKVPPGCTVSVATLKGVWQLLCLVAGVLRHQHTGQIPQLCPCHINAYAHAASTGTIKPRMVTQSH